MRLLFYLGLLAFLSLNPWILPDSGNAIGTLAWDKIDHAIAYALLAYLMISTCKFEKQPWLAALSVLLISSLIGITFEYGQLWLTSTRQFSLDDAIANVCGTFLGVVLFTTYRLLRFKKPEHLK